MTGIKTRKPYKWKSWIILLKYENAPNLFCFLVCHIYTFSDTFASFHKYIYFSQPNKKFSF